MWRDLLALVAGCVLTLVVILLTEHWKSYAGRKGENLATHEDIDMVLEQVKAVTQTTKEIEAKISTDVWDKQKRWELKRDTLFAVAKELSSMENALIALHSAYTQDTSPEGKHKDAALNHWNQCAISFDLAQNASVVSMRTAG